MDSKNKGPKVGASKAPLYSERVLHAAIEGQLAKYEVELARGTTLIPSLEGQLQEARRVVQRLRGAIAALNELKGDSKNGTA